MLWKQKNLTPNGTGKREVIRSIYIILNQIPFGPGEGINITTDFCICEEQRLEGLTLPPLQLLLSAWVHEFFLFWVVGIVYFQMERRFSRLIPFTHRQGKGEFAFFLLNTSFNFCSFIQGTAKKIRISFKWLKALERRRKLEKSTRCAKG